MLYVILLVGLSLSSADILYIKKGYNGPISVPCGDTKRRQIQWITPNRDIYWNRKTFDFMYGHGMTGEYICIVDSHIKNTFVYELPDERIEVTKEVYLDKETHDSEAPMLIDYREFNIDQVIRNYKVIGDAGIVFDPRKFETRYTGKSKNTAFKIMLNDVISSEYRYVNRLGICYDIDHIILAVCGLILGMMLLSIYKRYKDQR